MKRIFIAALVAFSLVPGFLPAAQTGWEWTKNEGWTTSEGSAKSTPKEQLIYAIKMEEAGDYYDAARQYFLLVRTYPNSAEAGQGLTRLAECLFEMENYYSSFKAIEDCIEKYPKSIHLGELLDLEFRIARKFMQGAPPTLFQSSNPKAQSLYAAVEVLESIIKHDPYGTLADGAYCELGMAYLELGEPRKAKDKLSIMVTNFPRSPLAPLARYRIALANIQLGHGTLTDAQRKLQELKTEIKQDSEREIGGMDRQAVEDNLEKIEDKEAEKMYTHGMFYEKRKSPKSYNAALFTYSQLIDRYPDSDAAARAKERVKILQEEGEPEAGLDEREFNLPNLPLPKVGKLAFWRKDEADAEEKTPQDTSKKSGYSGVDVFPDSKMQKIGSLVLDMDAEEKRLQSFGSKRYAPVEKPTVQTNTFSVEDALTAPLPAENPQPRVQASSVARRNQVYQAPVSSSMTSTQGSASTSIAPDVLPGGLPTPGVESFNVSAALSKIPLPEENISGTEVGEEGEEVLLNSPAEEGLQNKAAQLQPMEELKPQPVIAPAAPQEEQPERVDNALTPLPIAEAVRSQVEEKAIEEKARNIPEPAAPAIMPLQPLVEKEPEPLPEPVVAEQPKAEEPAPQAEENTPAEYVEENVAVALPQEPKAPAIMPLAPMPVSEPQPMPEPEEEIAQEAPVVEPAKPAVETVPAPQPQVVVEDKVVSEKTSPEAEKEDDGLGGWSLGSDFE